jgi:purine catabolism regulator
MYELEHASARSLRTVHTGLVPVSLRSLVAAPSLGIRVRTGRDLLDRPVTWVAVSEHEDPTPWLDGGELVLFTGVRLAGRPAATTLRQLVDRLVTAGAAGLGFGVGVVHDRSPRGLAAACAAAGLPFVEVPRPTPFVAVGKELARLVDEERAEGLPRLLHRMRRLSAAAARGDGSLLALLADHVGGWCLLLDAGGAVRGAAPAGAARRLGTAKDGVARVLSGGLQSSASLSTSTHRVDVLPLGAAGRLSGVLVAGSPGGDDETRGLVAYAASLLSLGHGRDAELVAARHDARALALTLALDGREAPLPGQVPWDGAAVRVAPLAADLDAVRASLEPLPEPAWAATPAPGPRSGTVAVWRADVHDRALAALAGTAGGVSAVTEAGEPGPGGQALASALAVATRRRDVAGGRLLVADGVAATSLLDLVEPTALAPWAAEELRPLTDRPDGAGLLAALRASLAHPASTEEAAAAAGVHRHTLRRRLRLVDDLLGGDPADPRRQAELLLAVAAARG